MHAKSTLFWGGCTAFLLAFSHTSLAVDDGIAPPPPANLKSTAVTPSTITLTWDAVKDNPGGSGMRDYRLFRSNESTGTRERIAIIDAAAPRTFTDKGVEDKGFVASKTYTYYMRAVDNQWNFSAWSSELKVEMAAQDTKAPPTPTEFKKTAATTSTITLTWNEVKDNDGGSGLLQYELFRTDPQGAKKRVGVIDAASPREFTDTTLAGGSTYLYRIRAIDKARNASPATPWLMTNTLSPNLPPTTPLGVTAVPVSTTAIAVSWQPSTDDTGVAYYEVYRNNVLHATVNTTSFNDIELPPGTTTYNYYVQAVDAAKLASPISSIVTAMALQKKYNPGHYILMWPDSDMRTVGTKYKLESSIFTGVQFRYYWRDLEPQKDVYDFSRIENDIAYLESIGKKLFIQIQDIAWKKSTPGFPDYLISSEYAGGYFLRYDGTSPSGEVIYENTKFPKKYLPAVDARLEKLIRKLGERFDGNAVVVGIVGEETSLGVNKGWNSGDFTIEAWESALQKQLLAMKESWPTTTKIIYVNWFDNCRACVGRIAQFAVDNDVGLGGPDVIYETASNPGYDAYPLAYGKQPLGTAVQWANYTRNDPKTGLQVTARQILDYGVNVLKLNHMFWAIREPYFSSDVVPTLNRTGAPINKEIYTP